MFSLARYILANVFLLLPLSVTSQGTPSITVSPEKLEFPAQTVGSPGVPQALTLSNSGSSPVDMRGILSSGIDFSQTNNCTEKLAAGAKCSVEIVFNPAVTGNRLGALQLTWSGAGSPRTIPLTGLGK